MITMIFKWGTFLGHNPLKSAKSTTYQALQNKTLIILWEGEGGPLQEILISIDSKLKPRLDLEYICK
jgi:hypothetical protein